MISYIENDKELISNINDYWSFNYEKNRYYQCTNTSFTNYTCKQMYYQDSFINNSKLIIIDKSVPKSLDKYILNYKLQPKITLEK
jgi:DNA modification methylase